MPDIFPPLSPETKAALIEYRDAYEEGLITASELYHWTAVAVAADHNRYLETETA